MRYNLHYRVGAANWKGWRHLGQWETHSEAGDELQSWQNPIRPSHGDIARIVSVKKESSLKPSKNEWAKNMPLYVFNEREWIPVAPMEEFLLRYTKMVPEGKLIEACFDLAHQIPNSMPVAWWVNRSHELVSIMDTISEIRRVYIQSDTTGLAAVSSRIRGTLIGMGRGIGRSHYMRVEQTEALHALAEVVLTPTPENACLVGHHVQRALDLMNFKVGHNRYRLREIVWKHITMSHAICGAMNLRQPTY